MHLLNSYYTQNSIVKFKKKCWILFPLRQWFLLPLNFKSTINAQDQLKIKKFSTTKSEALPERHRYC